MPFFDANPLEKLALQPDAADAELDLHGLTAAQAIQRVEQLLASDTTVTSYAIRFDAATEDGRETLFLPVGRCLLEARRTGRIARCLPLTAGNGFFIAFKD